MDQKKIGRFIAACRKEKKLTQSQLAQRLGVSDRSVSNWENGKNMPDLSLFLPLCDILQISVNELFQGERRKEEKPDPQMQEVLSQSIVYSSSVVKMKEQKISYLFLGIGILIILSGMNLFPKESIWSSVFSFLGCLVLMVGFFRIKSCWHQKKRMLSSFLFFLACISLLCGLDYINVVTNETAPRFFYHIEKKGNRILYQTPFYQVFCFNKDSVNEYYLVDTKKQYTLDTVLGMPFHQKKSGIENIIKYQSRYVGDNSNDANLIASLPLSEYGFVFQIEEKQLIIDYHTSDWYQSENLYIQKSLLYNSVAIFTLIENVDTITYRFSGTSYIAEREVFQNRYPNFSTLKKQATLLKENFRKNVEQKMNDDDFVISAFADLIK